MEPKSDEASSEDIKRPNSPFVRELVKIENSMDFITLIGVWFTFKSIK